MVSQHITKGRVIGVGVGPGDPGLVTRKAWAIVQAAPVIAYPSAKGGESLARAIMAEAIAGEAVEIALTLPMNPNRAPAQAAYDECCVAMRGHLDQGTDVIVLCEGDPLFYGSFMYILARLRDDYEVEIVPGVTSIQGATATHRQAIGARDDIVTVLPCSLDDAALSEQIDRADAVVMMKVGRHMGRIKALLDAKNLLNKALYVSHASQPQELALPLADAPETAPYFSIILLYKGDDPWL